MSGSDLQGRWMTEEDVLKLREAKYLSYEISHRLPAQGQAVPTPEPGEYVVFVSHLRRGFYPLLSPVRDDRNFYLAVRICGLLR